MATRSLTNFTDYNGKVVATVYKHWDGHPENMLELFNRFFDRCEALSSPRLDDPFYLAAKWVVFLAEEDRRANEDDRQYTDDPLDFLGVGIIAPETDAWEDYVYTVSPQFANGYAPMPEVTVTERV